MSYFRNTLMKFGDTYTVFEAESREELADEMGPLFRTWAVEHDRDAAKLREEFLGGLEEVSDPEAL